MIEPLQAVLIRMLLNEIKKYDFFFSISFVTELLLKMNVSVIV